MGVGHLTDGNQNFDAYVSYDLTGKPDSVEEEGDDEDSSPAWRQCKICGVKLYRLDSRAGKNEPAGASWVEVDLSNGIIVSDSWLSAMNH